jgi:phytoene/squalene synthetase
MILGNVPSPGDINSLDTLYAQAAEATRVGSRTLFFATRHFPLDLARSAHAVYWFCSYTRERGRQGREDIDQWASLVNSGLRGRLARHPVLDVFLDTLDLRAIPHDYPLDLIEGVRMDVEHTRYESFSQLRGLCQKITGAPTLMMTHVVGFRDPALDYMADLGLAIELTAKMRDIGENLTRDRIYLPLEEMQTFGYSESDLRSHTRNDAFRNLMRFQAERAHEYYQKAEPGLALLNRRGRFAVKVAFDLNRQILRHIESSDFDVFKHRTAIPAVERAWITARSMAGPITRRLWKVVGA